MQCTSRVNKNSPLSTLVFISACSWIQLPYLKRRRPLEFSTRRDLSRCFESLQRLQLEITCLNGKKRWSNNDDQRCNVWFCSLRLTVKCNVLFGLVCKEKWENTRQRLKRLPKMIIDKLVCRFKLVQFPPIANWNFILASNKRTWNCGMQSPHINEHRNLRVKNITFSSCIEYFCISGPWKIMNQSMQH